MRKYQTTWEEQKEKLKNRGLIFAVDSDYIRSLQAINYYRLSAYFLPFKKKAGSLEYYSPKLTLERVEAIYAFDKELRTLLFMIIEDIEIYARTCIAYFIAHKLGRLAYLDPEIFRPEFDHVKFINMLKKSIANHRHTPIVQKYIREREFPIWVIIEFFSMGMLSRFYGGLDDEERQGIAHKMFGESVHRSVAVNWFICLTSLRNRCAHYERLYYTNFQDIPALPNKQPYTYGQKLFGHVLILKFMFPDKIKWLNYVDRIENLVHRFSDYIDLDHIGFPPNWKDVLASEIREQTSALHPHC